MIELGIAYCVIGIIALAYGSYIEIKHGLKDAMGWSFVMFASVLWPLGGELIFSRHRALKEINKKYDLEEG